MSSCLFVSEMSCGSLEHLEGPDTLKICLHGKQMILAQLGVCAGAAMMVKASYSSNVCVYKRVVFCVRKRAVFGVYKRVLYQT